MCEMPEQEGNALIESVYARLITEIKTYRPTSSLKIVEDAYNLAKEAHAGQKRISGEPYVIHPLEVAITLAEIRSDFESIAAAILHDVVEDTHVIHEDVVAQFGEDVALLVAGVTKIEKVQYQSKTEAMAENYRKMFFHMSEDVRVLLIKIADRLHNMRTIEVKPIEKQISTAQETLDIYAPLAHRLGIAKLRYELEDLSFKYSNREFYENLSKEVELKTADRIEIIELIMLEIRAALAKNSIKATVEGRAKRLYSVYKKMISKKRTLEEIHDLYAIRVLVDDIAACYAVLGCVNGLYPVVPGRFKDYIAGKKSNGYQSLHTTLVGPGQHFEVQIRTFDMHDVAELGVAAHWKYKEGGKAAKDKWLQEIMAWQHEVSDSEDFLSALKMDLSAFQSHISCFTPKGQPINLIAGSCAIDFAYAIHSAVGNRMVSARVNGKIVPISHVLNSGDIVEITTSQNVKGPTRDWLSYVKTSQARTKINQWFNKENREENLQKGREILERTSAELNVSLDDLLADGRDKDVMARFNCKEINQIYVMVGNGSVKEKQVANYLYREYEKAQPLPTDEEMMRSLLESMPKAKQVATKSGVVLKGIDGDIAVAFSKCCNPVPGDEILGFTTRGRGVTVHRTDCVNVIHMNENERKRFLEAQWNVHDTNKQKYLVTLHITCPDGNHLLYNINDVLKSEGVRVLDLSAKVVQANAIFILGIEISDTDQLNHLTARLQASTKATEIRRISV